jgi:hypothetical protein
MEEVMNDAQKRAWVGELYPSSTWKKKVGKMPDAQIFAIWSREHNKPPKSKPTPKPKESSDDTPF